MILHAEERESAVAHALVGIVIQVEVRDFDLAGRQGIGVDGKAMILGGDLHVAGAHVFHGMIGAVMAKFQLVSAATQGQAAKLVTEANPEYGHAAEQFADIVHGVSDRFGIAGAVGEENAVGLHGQYVFGGSARRNDVHIAIRVDQQPKNILFYAEIVGDDAMAAGLVFGRRSACL